MKVVIANQMYKGSSEKILRFLVHSVRILCGFWNLDFFRSIIPLFCVSSWLSNMQALFLEYLYVFFPLCLIVFTAICIELHDRNFKPLVLAWKPFHKIFVRLQNTWDPTASIIYTPFLLLHCFIPPNSFSLAVIQFIQRNFITLCHQHILKGLKSGNNILIPVMKFTLSIIYSLCPVALQLLLSSLCVQRFYFAYILLKFLGGFCTVAFLQSAN